jgi:hypothetical protein
MSLLKKFKHANNSISSTDTEVVSHTAVDPPTKWNENGLVKIKMGEKEDGSNSMQSNSPLLDSHADVVTCMQDVSVLEQRVFELSEPDNLSDWPLAHIVLRYDNSNKLLGALRWSHNCRYGKGIYVHSLAVDTRVQNKHIGTDLINQFHADSTVQTEDIYLVVDLGWHLDKVANLLRWYNKFGYCLTQIKPLNPHGVVLCRSKRVALRPVLRVTYEIPSFLPLFSPKLGG